MINFALKIGFILGMNCKDGVMFLCFNVILSTLVVFCSFYTPTAFLPKTCRAGITSYCLPVQK